MPYDFDDTQLYEGRAARALTKMTLMPTICLRIQKRYLVVTRLPYSGPVDIRVVADVGYPGVRLLYSRVGCPFRWLYRRFLRVSVYSPIVAFSRLLSRSLDSNVGYAIANLVPICYSAVLRAATEAATGYTRWLSTRARLSCR